MGHNIISEGLNMSINIRGTSLRKKQPIKAAKEI